MKKIIVAVALIFTAVASNSLAYGGNVPLTKVREVNVGGRYSMMLPEYLTEGFDLNDEASLQYQNTAREVYIIVIDESKEIYQDVYIEQNDYDTTKDILTNYTESQMKSIRENTSKITHESHPRQLKTGSGIAIVYDVKCYQDGIDDEMGFTIAFVEGRFNVYMIMTWTYAKTIKDYQSDMDAMIISFKELSGAIVAEPYHIDADSFSVSIPGDFYQDSSIYVEHTVVGYAGYSRELYVVVNYHNKSNWIWDSRGFRTILDQFTIEQRNYIYSHAGDSVSSSEVTSDTINGILSRHFTVTATDTAGKVWLHEFQIYEQENSFYLIEIYTAKENLPANKQDMEMIINSFKVK